MIHNFVCWRTFFLWFIRDWILLQHRFKLHRNYYTISGAQLIAFFFRSRKYFPFPQRTRLLSFTEQSQLNRIYANYKPYRVTPFCLSTSTSHLPPNETPTFGSPTYGHTKPTNPPTQSSPAGNISTQTPVPRKKKCAATHSRAAAAIDRWRRAGVSGCIQVCARQAEGSDKNKTRVQERATRCRADCVYGDIIGAARRDVRLRPCSPACQGEARPHASPRRYLIASPAALWRFELRSVRFDGNLIFFSFLKSDKRCLGFSLEGWMRFWGSCLVGWSQGDCIG